MNRRGTLSNAQRVLLRVLQGLDSDVSGAKLVKLVYFIDYIYSRQEGRTLTGFGYVRDASGPTVIDNAVDQETEELVDQGLVRTKLGPKRVNAGSAFRAVPGAPLVKLDPVAELIVSDVLLKYRTYEPSQIANVSRRTAPFLKAGPGDTLDFRPAEAIGGRRQRSAMPGDEAESKTVDEITAEYGVA